MAQQTISLDALDASSARIAQGLAILSIVQEKLLGLADTDDANSIPRDAVTECAEALWGASALFQQSGEAIKNGRA